MTNKIRVYSQNSEESQMPELETDGRESNVVKKKSGDYLLPTANRSMAGDGSKKVRNLDKCAKVVVRISPTPMVYLQLRSRTLVIKPLTKRRRARVRKTADSVPALVNSGFADVTTGISSRCFSNFSVEVGRFGEEEERQWSRSDRFKVKIETELQCDDIYANFLVSIVRSAFNAPSLNSKLRRFIVITGGGWGRDCGRFGIHFVH